MLWGGFITSSELLNYTKVAASVAIAQGILWNEMFTKENMNKAEGKKYVISRH